MTNPKNAPFGSVLASTMAVAHYRDGAWGKTEFRVTGPLEIHPAAHALHYGSECFEGFKAYKHTDGSVNVFRLDMHLARMQNSARALVLPEPDPAQLRAAVLELIARVREDVPDAPGALYLRPLLIGTTPNIGAAATPATEAILIVLASPVWDYFAGGMKPLKILIEEHAQRCAPHLGMVKTGGNYAAAMGPTLAARKQYGVDQVLFCPGGSVQETGASNFVLLRAGELLTRSLDPSFLHGVTRDSILVLARDLGYRVEERVFDVAELLAYVQHGEAALSGTAAVLSGVGTLVRDGKEFKVGDGGIGPETLRLRNALVAIQQGTAPDRYGWLTRAC
ncbi:MAG: branched-chain amino acid aminotransferase [Gammaproteobacteria bacterium]|nr:branched-chain amino acid aminotransferase [Gammaproteobacteria bacterium]